MIKRQTPTVTQANVLFFITATVTLVGSALFQPLVGLGTNLWINEFVYILLPALLIAKWNAWSIDEMYRFKRTSSRNKLISIFSGVSMWFFAFYLSKMIRVFLDHYFGILPIVDQNIPSVYQSILLVLGMIILAPICEEIFFRGFMQKAYETQFKKYGFIVTGCIFGLYHVLNGVSEILPATVLGLGMGYLMYKTNSISTSMIFHAAANISAVFLGGMIETRIKASIPIWLHVIALAGFFTSVMLLRRLEVDEETGEAEVKLSNNKKVSVIGVVFLGLSVIYLIGIGALELLVRLAII